MQLYFDYAATTPLDARVLDVMLPYFQNDYGNPSSLHRAGQQARRAVETAREQVAAAIGAKPKEIIFTSGATEADNTALRATFAHYPNGHIITSGLEHAAVLETARHLAERGYAVTFLQPNRQGEITPAAVEAAFQDNTVLVALMHTNNETGVITDIAAIAEIAHERGALIFCDAVQAFGFTPVSVTSLGADMLALSGHKIYGPKGVGVLYVRDGLELSPFLIGGQQERGRRAGTHNTPAIVGMGKAAELTEETLASSAQLAALRDRLEAQLLQLEGVHSNILSPHRGPKHCNIRVDGVDGEALLMSLDTLGVCVSAGSACAAGSLSPSHVLTAMGLSDASAKASIRLSLGEGITTGMVNDAVVRFSEAVTRCRTMLETTA
jgi:cysteine desulfurase